MPQRPFLPAYIFRTYAQSSLVTRLFILIRSWVCPFQAIIDSLQQAGPPCSILDIGCGHGLFLHLIHLNFPEVRCYGLDHDPHKIAIARRSRGKRPLAFMHTDDGKDPLPSSVDCVCLIDVLYSIPPAQWRQMLRLADQRLKPGGLLIVKETVNRPRWKYFICLVQEILATRILKYTKGEFPTLAPVGDYLQQLAENGFEVISHRRLDRGYLWPHYLFVARRSGMRSNIQ